VKRLTPRFTESPCAAAVVAGVSEFQERFSRPEVFIVRTRSVPFTLFAGESVEIFVEATPRDYGERQAYLKVEGDEPTHPGRTWQVLSSLHAWGLAGPRFVVFPEGTLQFPYPLRPRSPERVIFVDNVGDEEAIRNEIAITGPDASQFAISSQHAAIRHIPPGDGEMFLLSLTHPCSPTALSTGESAVSSGSWQGTLQVSTSEGILGVPLIGRPLQCFDLSAPERSLRVAP
jgi:hypothetical protein